MDTPGTEIKNTNPLASAKANLWGEFVSSVFANANLSIGWSFSWRIALVGFILGILVMFVLTLTQADPFWNISMIPITIFLYDRVGKRIIDQRLGLQVDKFIGWEIFWRDALIRLAAWAVLAIPIYLVNSLLFRGGFSPPAVLEVLIRFLINLALVCILFYTNLVGTGWAIFGALVKFSEGVHKMEMYENLVEIINQKMDEKSTEELLEIRKGIDEHPLSEEAIDAVERIIIKRGTSLPSKPPKYPTQRIPLWHHRVDGFSISLYTRFWLS